MSWVRRHPFAAAIFAIIFAIFALSSIFGADDEVRASAILGLIIIYLLLVGVYALAAWLFGKIFRRSGPQVPIPPIPSFPQQQFPQWDWSARTTLPIACWRCRATNPPGAAFCDQCGAHLANVAAPPPPGNEVPNFAPVPPPVGAVECPRCHTRLSPQVRFCTNCGLPQSSN